MGNVIIYLMGAGNCSYNGDKWRNLIPLIPASYQHPQSTINISVVPYGIRVMGWERWFRYMGSGLNSIAKSYEGFNGHI